MKEITLSQGEFLHGALCGVMRGIKSLAAGGSNKHGRDWERFWDIQIEGACGEIAAARALDRFWSPRVNVFKAADIGDNIQVRTLAKHHYDLIVREDDSKTDFFILVTGRAPIFRVHGGILGADAMTKGTWAGFDNDRPPVWRVPQSALTPIETILGEVAAA